MSRQPSPSQSRGRVCVIRQHYVPQDTRVARAVAALAASGCDVDVICLRNRGEPRLERDGRVLIWRVPLRHPRGRGAGGYLAAYGGFFLVAASLSTALHARHRYRLLQVHSLPDVLVFAAAATVAFGRHVHWGLHEVLELDHGERSRWVHVVTGLAQAEERS